MADYSFILLAKMISEEKESWSATELSARTALPLPTVAKLMKLLAKAGIVQGLRGVAGGYKLSAPANTISIARVVEAVDGPIALTDCVDESDLVCAVKTLCPMHGGWNKINTAIRSALENTFLSDLVAVCYCPVEMSATNSFIE